MIFVDDDERLKRDHHHLGKEGGKTTRSRPVVFGVAFFEQQQRLRERDTERERERKSEAQKFAPF